MTKTLQLKRGNTAKNDAYTGAVAELTVDTEAKALRIHDGTTAGGITLSAGGEANVINKIQLNGTDQTVTDKTVNLLVQTPLSSTNKVSSMFIDDTVGGAQNTHKFVTASDKTNWNNKQEAISDLGTIRTNASEALKQKSTLPEASSTELGKIYQFIGATTASYTNGFMYQCSLNSYTIALSGTFEDDSLIINEEDFIEYVSPTADTTITLTWNETADSWKIGDDIVEYSDYGISYNGTPIDGDTIIITYTAPAYGWNNISVEDLSNIDRVKSQTTGYIKFWTGTQAEYDLIQNKDPMTMYIILPAQS